MSWNLPAEERETLLTLPARDRYNWFIELTVDWEEAWGLRSGDGWRLAEEGEKGAFPLWPHPDLAAACAIDDWADAEPQAIGLDELLEDLLPILEEDGLTLAIFPVPDGEVAIVSPADLRRDLEAEIALSEEEEEEEEDEDEAEDEDGGHGPGGAPS